MQVGYVLCSQDLNHVLCLKNNKKGVEMIEIESTKDINRSICLSDLTEVKNVYERLCEAGLVRDLDIVNVAKLYKKFY